MEIYEEKYESTFLEAMRKERNRGRKDVPKNRLSFIKD